MTATTKAKNLSKAQEIELIKKLAAGGGYWAEYFQGDADRMISNIQNDFHIEMKTSVDLLKHKLAVQQRANGQLQEKVDQLKREEDMIISNLEKAKAELNRILERLVVLDSEFELCSPYEFFTFEQVVKVKLAKGIKLNDREQKDLVKIIENAQ